MSRRGRHRRVKVYDEMHRGERRVVRAASAAMVAASMAVIVASLTGAVDLDGGEWIAPTSLVLGMVGLIALRPR